MVPLDFMGNYPLKTNYNVGQGESEVLSKLILDLIQRLPPVWDLESRPYLDVHLVDTGTTFNITGVELLNGLSPVVGIYSFIEQKRKGNLFGIYATITLSELMWNILLFLFLFMWNYKHILCRSTYWHDSLIKSMMNRPGGSVVYL